jgi:hypothetical protein
MHWSLPSGQTYQSSTAHAGPRSDTFSDAIYFVSGNPLPDGTYTVELRAGSRQLARATVTRDC